jgi:hypothetical protein
VPDRAEGGVFRLGIRNMNEASVTARSGMYSQMLGRPFVVSESTLSTIAVGIRSA